MVVMEEEYHMILILKIHYAEGIDRQTTDHKGDKMIYYVLGWINHVKEFRTSRTEVLPNPEWNTIFQIPLSRLYPGGFRYLNLEVLKIRSKSDPRTSTIFALVGRTHIPLPKDINRKKVQLFRANGAKRGRNILLKGT
ncbi:hypothetical protein LguiB_006311 [Lonicera macranthoides]